MFTHCTYDCVPRGIICRFFNRYSNNEYKEDMGGGVPAYSGCTIGDNTVDIGSM